VVPGRPNEVTVVAWDAAGHLSSRGVRAEWTPPGSATPASAPTLWVIAAGISRYAAPEIALQFAAKDAAAMAAALKLGGQRLFGAEKVKVTLLASDDDGALTPTKDHLARAFEAARAAKPEDVVVVYLAGHAVTLPGTDGLYAYLTQDARSADPSALADEAVRATALVTSEELTEWTKKIPALKQVMILDTCAAGAAAAKLAERRAVSPDQIRAIERLKDRTGFYVLMGSAADAASYEASRFGQGLLTYALLEGMKGAALRDEQFVDVGLLFQRAVDRVPELARDIGGIQQPSVAAPRGASFDIGQFVAADRDRIPLSRSKPIILRPQFGNERNFDILGLGPKVRARLREAALRPRGGGHVFVDAGPDELADGLVPVARYTTTGGGEVKVDLWLYRRSKEVFSAELKGAHGDLDGLADRIAETIVAASADHEAPTQ
jgi:hypothetical protein